MQRDDALRRRRVERLAAWPRQAPDQSGLQRAAVALAITDEGRGSGLWRPQQAGYGSTQAAWILTQRARHLRRRAGPRALPGGRIDADVLGRLDSFITRSGFAMKPGIVWAGEAPKLTPDPAEVAASRSPSSCAPTRRSLSHWRAANTRC